jgi:hypothetical protein
MRLILTIFLIAISTYSYALKPFKEYKATPQDYNIKYEEILISNGKAKINTWYLNQNVENTRSIIICNSDYGNMSYSLNTASKLYENGFNVIMFDYRGFGSSSYFNIDSNMLFYNEFSEDLENVYKYYSEKTKNTPIIYGISMGTIIATNCYSLNPKLFNTKFVFDSFIESLKNTKSVLFSMKNRVFTTRISNDQYGLNIEKIQKANVLIFKGSNDNVSFDAASSLNSPTWQEINFDGGHMQGSYVLGEHYWSSILNFIAK